MIWRASQTEQFLSGKPINRDDPARRPGHAETGSAANAPVPARDGRGRNQPGVPASVGGELLLQVRSCTSRWPSMPKQVAAGECVGGESSRSDRCRTGTQECTEYPELFPVTQPIIKRAAFVQASGEVRYTQDIPVADRRPARGDGKELAAARAILAHTQGSPRWRPSRSCSDRNIPISRRSSPWPISRRG